MSSIPTFGAPQGTSSSNVAKADAPERKRKDKSKEKTKVTAGVGADNGSIVSMKNEQKVKKKSPEKASAATTVDDGGHVGKKKKVGSSKESDKVLEMPLSADPAYAKKEADKSGKSKETAPAEAPEDEVDVLTEQDVSDLNFILTGINKETTPGITGKVGVATHLLVGGADYILQSKERKRLHEGGKSFLLLNYVLGHQGHKTNMTRIVTEYGDTLMGKLHEQLIESVVKFESKDKLDVHVKRICSTHKHLNAKIIHKHIEAAKQEGGSFLGLIDYALGIKRA